MQSILPTIINTNIENGQWLTVVIAVFIAIILRVKLKSIVDFFEWHRTKGSVALVIRQRNFAGTALRHSNWTDHSRQRRKLVGERHRMRAVVRELALADHVDQFDAGEDGAGGAE